VPVAGIRKLHDFNKSGEEYLVVKIVVNTNPIGIKIISFSH
jgi:hypothetical protein